MAPSGCFPVYNLVFDLQVEDSIVKGTTWHFSDSSNYIKQTVKGLFHANLQTLELQETGIISQRLRADCSPCQKHYKLYYSQSKQGPQRQELIRGEWYTPDRLAQDGISLCEPGTILLSRDSSSIKTKDASSTLHEKATTLYKELMVDSGYVQIELYDNGEIDGDTISIFVNEKPVLSHQMLDSKPIKLSVRIDPRSPRQEVVMVGENMGRIPPNTALMIINDGKNRHQVYLKSNQEQHAMVRFIYHEKRPATKN